MTQTTATVKQSQAIKQRMQEIRSDLPHDVDEARARARQLADWKYHFKRRPAPFLIGAALLGYAMVPGKRSGNVVVHNAAPTTAPAKRGLVSGIVGSATTLLMRQALQAASSHASDWFRNVHTPPSRGDRQPQLEEIYP